MMIQRLNTILVISFLALMTLGSGCVSQQEYDELRAENEKLKKELEECKHGAERLLKQAQAYFDEKQLEKAKGQLNLLLEKHPVSDEAVEGKKLLAQIENLIEKAEKEKQRRLAEAARERKRRLAEAIKKMRKEHNEFKATTFYEDKSSPKYVNANGIFLMFNKDDDSDKAGALLLRIQYYASDWLFVESYQFVIDGKRYSLTPLIGVQRDNGDGWIWEWSTEPVIGSTCNLVKTIIESKKAKIRFVGKPYYADKIITTSQKSAMRNVVDAYKALGGESDCL